MWRSTLVAVDSVIELNIGMYAVNTVFDMSECEIRDIVIFRGNFQYLHMQVLHIVDKSESHYHSLALLAEETKELLRKDYTMFMPIFSKRHPKAAIVSSSLLHRFYGHKLVRLVNES